MCFMLRSLFAMRAFARGFVLRHYIGQFFSFYFLSLCLCGGVTTMGYVEKHIQAGKCIQGKGICLRLSVRIWYLVFFFTIPPLSLSKCTV